MNREPENLTLRERAALAVLPDVYRAAVASGCDNQQAVAEEAVEIADALIAALEPKP